MQNPILPNNDSIDPKAEFLGTPDVLREPDIAQEPLIAETQEAAAKNALEIAQSAETETKETANTDPQHRIDDLEGKGLIPKSPHKSNLIAFLRLLQKIGLDTSSMTAENFKAFFAKGAQIVPTLYILLSTPAEVLARDLQVGDNMQEIAELIGKPQKQYHTTELILEGGVLLLIAILAKIQWNVYKKRHPKAPKPAADATATPRRRLRLPFTRRTQEDPQAEIVIDKPTMIAFANEIQNATKRNHPKQIFRWNTTEYKNPAKLEKNKAIIIAAINNVFGNLTTDQRQAYEDSIINNICIGVQGRGLMSMTVSGDEVETIEIQCTGDITQDSTETTLIQALTDKGIITEAPKRRWRDRLRRDPPEVRAQNKDFKEVLKNIAKGEASHYDDQAFGPFTQERAKRFVDALNQSPEQAEKKEIWIHTHNGDPAAVSELANIRIREFAINIVTQTITLALAEELQKPNATEIYIKPETDKIENILRDPELIDKLARINCALTIHDDTASDEDQQRLTNAIVRNPNHIPQNENEIETKYGLESVEIEEFDMTNRDDRLIIARLLNLISISLGLMDNLRRCKPIRLMPFGGTDNRTIVGGADGTMYINLKKAQLEIVEALRRYFESMP